MKQRFLLLITALMLCMGARAENTTEQVFNGLRYIIHTDENYAELISYDYRLNNTQSEVVIPASITWEGKKYPVTELGNNCFSSCYYLTSVTIPSSVTSLGYGCFQGCDGLTSITIPSSVTSIGNLCFWYCRSLTSITIPSSVTSIGSNCFSNCNNLATIYISPKEIYASKTDNWHFANALSAYKDKLKPYIQFVTADGTPYKYSTLCLKNRVNLNDGTCENMGEIYTVTSVGSGKAILDRVTTGVLEPGVAYIVANNNQEGLTIPNGATFTLDETAGLLDEPIKSAFMQGTFDDTYAPAGSYVLQPDGKFHIVA